MAKPAKTPQPPLHPDAQAAFRKALAFHQDGKLEEAAAGYREALRLDLNHQHAWINLAVVLRKVGMFEASVICSRRALEFAPQEASYLMNYGNCLVDLNRIDEALAALREADRINPGDFKILSNYYIALRESGDFADAPAFFSKLHEMKPGDVATQWEEALAYLKLGDFRRGWEAFEVRWKMPPMAERAYPNALRWQGEDLTGKTILVHEEQGFGDSILCSRYIPLIHARGGRVILECKPALHRLFSKIPGIVSITEPKRNRTGFDYHIPMMSLPRIFGTDLANIPPPAPLFAAPTLPDEVMRLLSQEPGTLKIGIIWSGSVTFAGNHKRAVTADRFLPFAEIPGVRLFSLQKGPRENDMAAIGGEALAPSVAPLLKDFSETAAVLKKLDLVIMTDSSVAHVAGSLGVPVWNMLTFNPYWLYLTERSDSPWYPSMRLFRQPKPGDWDSVFAEVAAALKSRIEKGPAAP